MVDLVVHTKILKCLNAFKRFVEEVDRSGISLWIDLNSIIFKTFVAWQKTRVNNYWTIVVNPQRQLRQTLSPFKIDLLSIPGVCFNVICNQYWSDW